MVNIKIIVEMINDITLLPDSQKIFGSLVYLYAKHYGDKKASEFVKKVQEGQIKFMLSSLLPDGYVPTPKVYIIQKITEFISGKDVKEWKDVNTNLKAEKELYQIIKGIDYIPLETMIKLFNEFPDLMFAKELTKEIENLEDDFIKLKHYQQQRVGVTAQIDNLSGIQPKLYSTPKKYVIRQRKNEEPQIVRQFEFWLQVEDDAQESYEIEKMLAIDCEKEALLLLGRRATQGNNVFKMVHLEKSIVKKNDTSHYLNLGKLLPEQIDYQRSYLELFTSKRKPYYTKFVTDRSLDERCFISYLAEGSIICKSLEADKFTTIKSIVNPFLEGTILFGNAYLYPVRL